MLTFALAGFGLSWAIVLACWHYFLKFTSLPKSGSWMNTVKVVLGFIELALALKFLSKADLVSKTFLLKRELFIGIWIVIAIGLALYLFGRLNFTMIKTKNLYYKKNFRNSKFWICGVLSSRD